MKVILLKDVKSLGKADDIVEVSPGYANNMLLRKNLALEATPENLNSVKTKKKAEDAKAKRELEQAREVASEMENKTFIIKAKCGEAGKLYGAITPIDIAKSISSKGYKVDKRGITMSGNIKSLGTYEVQIKLHTQVTANINVKVEQTD